MERSFLGNLSLTGAMLAVPPPPPRFTLSEWYLSTRQRYRTAEDQHQLAERIMAESDRVRNQTDDATKLNKTEVDRRLAERIKDIEFRKGELEKQRAEACKEEEALVTYKERILDAMESLKETALKICKKCVTFRENRLGIDLVHDDVERELLKEIQTIQGAQSLLQRTLEQTKEQIRLLRSTKYFIDRDCEDKYNALKIDDHCVKLEPTSLNLSLYTGTVPLDAGNISQEEWLEFSAKNIERASKEVNNARPLRSYVDTLLKQVIDDLWKQYHVTNEAFRRRIEETREAKEKLEKKHYETVKKANEMGMNITKLEKAIAEKEGYMALAHTRLGNRSQRPAVELTRDEGETRLIAEVQDLKENVERLQDMLAESQASLRYLLRLQLQLEEDINVKTNTLKIDEVDCMTIRESMDYHAY
ncbi:tektin-1 [Anabrus simplex]|uniref:tektin-1 n=1 Tax=Anabrus simplex TaxID=316456 RepID=UPI0034DCD827